MSRESQLVGEWRLSSGDPFAVANARSLLALLRAVRRLPWMLEPHAYDDLGCELTPLLQLLPVEVESAIRPKSRRRKVQQDHRLADADADAESDKPIDISDRGIHLLIGKGLARNLPQFRKLGQKLEHLLEQFVDGSTCVVDKNVEYIAETLGLDAHATEFVRLAASIEHGTVDRSLFSFVKGSSKLLQVLPAILGRNGSAIHALATGNSPLFTSGLLRPDGDRPWDLEDLLELSNLGVRMLGTPVRSRAELARLALSPLERRQGTRALVWPHLAAEQSMILAMINGTLKDRRPGVNVLIYGPPGTGKSEFVRDLIRRVEATGYQVRVDDDEGGEAMRHERLANLLLCQRFASHEERSVLVLDEAEDVFQDEASAVFGSTLRARGRSRRSRGETKGFVNRMLETNPHPVIWISNRIEHLDPAYLRRFAFCLEFPRSPIAVRRQIAADYLEPVGCSTATVNRVAANSHMVPALLASAAECVAAACDCGLPADEIVRIQLDQCSKALGFPVNSSSPALAMPYDLRFLNIGDPGYPQRLIDALTRVRRASLLFSGEPGTGKTQFAAELAKRLGRELIYRTAADINSMWFGGSERNVASLFTDCDPQSDLLFLDEAEVLLGARESAGHRAVEAVTAEFLRRIEAFDGVFVCATNHSGSLDMALMRRFVFRVEFQPLRAEQRIALLRTVCQRPTASNEIAIDIVTPALHRRLQRLYRLTPGDYANVFRRADALGTDYSADEWVTELEAEHAAKHGEGNRSMGFL